MIEPFSPHVYTNILLSFPSGNFRSLLGTLVNNKALLKRRALKGQKVLTAKYPVCVCLCISKL